MMIPLNDFIVAIVSDGPCNLRLGCNSSAEQEREDAAESHCSSRTSRRQSEGRKSRGIQHKDMDAFYSYRSLTRSGHDPGHERREATAANERLPHNDDGRNVG